jgi:hypothetical protein
LDVAGNNLPARVVFFDNYFFDLGEEVRIIGVAYPGMVDLPVGNRW